MKYYGFMRIRMWLDRVLHQVFRDRPCWSEGLAGIAEPGGTQSLDQPLGQIGGVFPLDKSRARIGSEFRELDSQLVQKFVRQLIAAGGLGSDQPRSQIVRFRRRR